MTTRTASNASELNTALSASSGGDTVELQTGSFGSISLSGHSFASDVTITEGAGQTATISGFSFTGCDHIKVDGVTVTHGGFSSGSNGRIVGCDGTSSYITFTGCTIYGPTQSVYDGGYGVEFASGSSHCTVTRCEIGKVRIPIVVISSSNCTITYNNITIAGEDSIKGFGDDSVCDYNRLADEYYPDSGDHPDGIQCNNSVDNLTIRYNIIIASVNPDYQGIFFGGGPSGQTHSNITIEENLILGQLNNGISQKTGLSHTTTNVVIRNNTVGFYPDDSSVKKATYIAWPGATYEYNVEMRNVSPGPGLHDPGARLALTPYSQPQTYGTDNFYADIAVAPGTSGSPSVLDYADFAPVASSLVDPDTQWSSVYGSADLIDQWIAAETWPPPEGGASPSSSNRPLTTGGRILLRGGLPLIAG